MIKIIGEIILKTENPLINTEKPFYQKDITNANSFFKLFFRKLGRKIIKENLIKNNFTNIKFKWKNTADCNTGQFLVYTIIANVPDNEEYNRYIDFINYYIIFKKDRNLEIKRITAGKFKYISDKEWNVQVPL